MSSSSNRTVIDICQNCDQNLIGNNNKPNQNKKSEENDIEDDDSSISQDSQDHGSENDGPSSVKEKTDHEIWQNEVLWESLQSLPGAYPKLIEYIKREDVSKINSKNPQVLDVALLLATYFGKSSMLKSLLSMEANVNCSDSDGRTPLHLAANNGDLDSLKLLLQHGANVDSTESTKKVSPLHCAASKGHLQCIKALVKGGADVDSRCKSKDLKTPLHYAVENQKIDCVQELLHCGAQPNTLQVFSESPIHTASSWGATEIVKLLLEHGASVNVHCGPEKSTPLHLAVESGSKECVSLLLKARANVGALNGKKKTPLHVAAFCQASDSLELLLKAGGNPNAADSDGRTPLHCAIVKVSRSSECVKLLIAHGANVNKPDAFGYTPLHLAALNEFSTCVMMLINAGGDLTARTKGGISALTFITRRTPDVIPKYLGKLDGCIRLTDHEIGDVDCELKIDFKMLVPHSLKGETELLLNFIEVGHREVLTHPLFETFLFLKWRRIRKYFLFSLFYHSLYVLLFTIYTIGVFLKDCQSKKGSVNEKGSVNKTNTVNETDVPDINCEITRAVKITGYILISLNFLLLSKELFQIVHNWLTYVKQWENWLQWLIIFSVYLCVLRTHPELSDVTNSVYAWQHHVGAVGIFLAWLELMMIVGRFPIFGLYIQMFTTVSLNFAKFLLAYLCLLIAFGLSFGVLFANYKSFKNIYLGIMKTIIMMSGELEFEDIFYTDDTEVKYAGTAHVMFLAFVLLVTVILTNLMVGLAVSDIQGLQQSAGLDRLVRQAELVAHLESMLFSRLLYFLPKKIMAFFHKHALLLKNQQLCALYIRPNDPREERIPKNLIKSVYQLVAERKLKRRRRSNKEAMNRSNSISGYVSMGKSTNKLLVDYKDA